ncbi:MAG: nucleoside hydrolase [Atopobiaceae bacterium]|nr:nucleoside hydrolase [Atopobiaceae bacterium]
MDNAKLLSRLECPEPGKVLDIVIDSDPFNEIDDPYAISYAVRSPERFRVLALHAAPFFTGKIAVIKDKAASPAEGMEKSYEEMHRIVSLLGATELEERIHRGSETYLPDEETPVESPAARNLVRIAMERSPEDDPLYVVGIGAITNIASAILMEPAIIERIVVVWLGGHAHTWEDNAEFNMEQDVAAARVVFGSGVPLVSLPCKGVVSHYRISGAELDRFLLGKNELCDYLVNITTQEAHKNGHDTYWSRVIWDVTPFAWLVNPAWCPSYTRSAAIPEYDDRWAFDERRHPMRYVYFVRRDDLLEDMCIKLTR